MQADSLLEGNKRKMKVLYKRLDTSNLHLRLLFHCTKSTIWADDMVCFMASNTQYHTMIRAKSGPQTGKIIMQDEPFRTTPQAIRKTVRDKRAFITHDLTFPYIYFVALFYQKKSRKSVSPSSGFSLKTPTLDKMYKKYVFFLRRIFFGCSNAILLLCENRSVTVHPPLRPEFSFIS